MFIEKRKPRKCRFRKCRAEFQPVTDWQKFCSVRCRSAVQNKKHRELFQKAKLIVAQHEKETV